MDTWYHSLATNSLVIMLGWAAVMALGYTVKSTIKRIRARKS